MQIPLLGLHQKLACTILCSSGVADPGFSRVVASTPKVKMQAYYYGRFFQENCMKSQKIGTRGQRTCDPPMLCLHLESWEAHEKILRSHLAFDKT